MKARIIGITTPAVEDIFDSEGLISYSARVSNPSNQTNFDTAHKLLTYCKKHGHWSVFEMCNVIMEIEAPRDIARQILRHRSFSFQEFSQRYSKSTDFMIREARLQDYKNRQNSIEDVPEGIQEWWHKAQSGLLEQTKEVYQKALDKGIAKECARVILPEGNTMSRMYMNGTVRSWMHYCDLRCDKATQKEHRIVADECREALKQHLPNLF